MELLYTSTQVAALLGLDPSSVRKRADKLGIASKMGRDRIFTEDDVRKLRQAPKPGRPRGNS